MAVFDELDSGVGGRIGARVGSSLRRLASAGHQVRGLRLANLRVTFSESHSRVVTPYNFIPHKYWTSLYLNMEGAF